MRGEVIGDRYRLERPVALKVLAPGADRARFEREARAAAPARLAALAAATLALDPRNRPENGAALAAELGAGGPRDSDSTSAPTMILPRPPRPSVRTSTPTGSTRSEPTTTSALPLTTTPLPTTALPPATTTLPEQTTVGTTATIPNPGG